MRDPVGGGAVEMSKLRLLDLFSGIGGFSLGLERSGGFETVAFCEIEDFPRRVLAKHWPKVPQYHDIRELTADRLAADGIAVDAICGGFPCQDISNAGKQAGIEGERSGLWSEYARLIGELRPRVVFVENVSALLGRGLDRVLGDLAALRYDAWWDCIPASAVGAPHRRDRLWLVAWNDAEAVSFRADADSLGSHRAPLHVNGNAQFGHEQEHVAGSVCDVLADVKGERGRSGLCKDGQVSNGYQLGNGGQDVADAISSGRPGQGQPVNAGHSAPYGEGQAAQSLDGGFGHQWSVEPNVGRVAHGVPDRAQRLKALGNAVVPQIPELLGRAWMEANHV